MVRLWVFGLHLLPTKVAPAAKLFGRQAPASGLLPCPGGGSGTAGCLGRRGRPGRRPRPSAGR